MADVIAPQAPPKRILLATDLSARGDRALDRATQLASLWGAELAVVHALEGPELLDDQGIPSWRRAQRLGVRSTLELAHLMASAALPFVFPAVKINREYFGDGSMRQLAPVSPAIHLGADRILVIGAGRTAEEGRMRVAGAYPSPAQIAGHALSSIFLDTLEVDLERLARINDTVSRLDASQREQAGIALRSIECLVIQPSQRLDTIAARHAQHLPPPVQRQMTVKVADQIVEARVIASPRGRRRGGSRGSHQRPLLT